jgi:GNAT superfamily N-acetyltransferase
MQIHVATSEDIPALSELLSVLFSQEAEFTPDDEAQRRGLARILGDPESGVVLVAKDGELVLGMVNLLFTVSTAFGERVALLEDMVVSPRIRGGGVGSVLLQHAISVARASGCKRVTLLTDRSNTSAQRFYGKHGFTASTMLPMRLVLT